MLKEEAACVQLVWKLAWIVRHNSSLVLAIKNHICSDSVSGSLSGSFLYTHHHQHEHHESSQEGAELSTQPSEASVVWCATVSHEIQIHVYMYIATSSTWSKYFRVVLKYLDSIEKTWYIWPHLHFKLEVRYTAINFSMKPHCVN